MKRSNVVQVVKMPGVGFEPTWVNTPGILSPLRLPFRHPGVTTSYVIPGEYTLEYS